jgi:hypothetical protein
MQHPGHFARRQQVQRHSPGTASSHDGCPLLAAQDNYTNVHNSVKWRGRKQKGQKSFRIPRCPSLSAIGIQLMGRLPVDPEHLKRTVVTSINRSRTQSWSSHCEEWIVWTRCRPRGIPFAMISFQVSQPNSFSGPNLRARLRPLECVSKGECVAKPVCGALQRFAVLKRNRQK